jgi:hypothetical protein
MEATKLAPDVEIVIYILEVSGSSIGRDTNSCDGGVPCNRQHYAVFISVFLT